MLSALCYEIVNLHMWSEQGSQAHRYWGAATVNNTVNEFNNFATDDGINKVPEKLDIFIGRNKRYGYALMSVQNDFSSFVGAPIESFLNKVFGVFNPIATFVARIPAKAYLQMFLSAQIGQILIV